MVFLNWKDLPWYWYGFDSFWLRALMVVLVPGALAFVFGWLRFRSRVTGVYLSIITQAMTFALCCAFFRNDMGFGGNNGLTDFKDLLGFDLPGDSTRAGSSRATAGAGAGLPDVPVSSCRRSSAGAGRDPRCRKPGALPRLPGRILQVVRFHRLGDAGGDCRRALRAPGGIINPGEFSPANSIEIVDLGRGWRARAHCMARSLGAFVNYRQDLPDRRPPRSGFFCWVGCSVGHPCSCPRGSSASILPFARREHAAGPLAGAPDGDGMSSMPAQTPRNRLLYLDGVSVSFDGFKALNSLSFYASPGELRAIIGPNGAGKTTMMDVVTGKTRPDDGPGVVSAGRPISPSSTKPRSPIWASGESFRNRRSSKPTVFENLDLALKPDRRSANPVCTSDAATAARIETIWKRSR